ncbi:MAG TPA: hypothetical protein DDY13_12490 [Cytophagales bacterium]|jgi:predicted small lipoprotein YifL|nr:hypothetical protein [Cytophagales bacterium]
MKNWWMLFLLMVFFLGTCGRKKQIEGFDSDKWIADKMACQEQRSEMRKDLLRIKYKLRGLNTDEIEDVLGKPDAQELYRRNQKYYIYYLEPAPECDTYQDQTTKVYIRFTAVGIAHEITFREE